MTIGDQALDFLVHLLSKAASLKQDEKEGRGEKGEEKLGGRGEGESRESAPTCCSIGAIFRPSPVSFLFCKSPCTTTTLGRRNKEVGPKCGVAGQIDKSSH